MEGYVPDLRFYMLKNGEAVDREREAKAGSNCTTFQPPTTLFGIRAVNVQFSLKSVACDQT